MNIKLAIGDLTMEYSDTPGQRRCGDCQLCCKLLPVRALDKPASARCKYQRVGKGCLVHGKPQMPHECQLWSCRWLFDEAAKELQRPDRVHYVIDIMPDVITANGRDLNALQVWVDPAFPDAHRDPPLRRFLAERGEKDRMPAIIRFGSRKSFVLIPPALASDGQWHEVEGMRFDPGGSGNRFVDKLTGRR